MLALDGFSPNLFGAERDFRVAGSITRGGSGATTLGTGAASAGGDSDQISAPTQPISVHPRSRSKAMMGVARGCFSLKAIMVGRSRG